MGACGCGDTSPYFRFKGPEGSWYALHIYFGCRECDNPAGIVLFKHDAPDDTMRLFDGAPQRSKEELAFGLFGSQEIEPSEVGTDLPLVSRDVMKARILRLLTMVDTDRAELLATSADGCEELAGEIADDLDETVIAETIREWEVSKETGCGMKSDIGTGCEGCWHGLCVDRGIKSRDENLPLCHSAHPMPADKRGVSLPALQARLSALEERAAACGACKGSGRDRSRGGVVQFRLGHTHTPDVECETCRAVRQEVIDVRNEVVRLQHGEQPMIDAKRLAELMTPDVLRTLVTHLAEIAGNLAELRAGVGMAVGACEDHLRDCDALDSAIAVLREVADLKDVPQIRVKRGESPYGKIISVQMEVAERHLKQSVGDNAQVASMFARRVQQRFEGDLLTVLAEIRPERKA